jgi:hypothetical protein
VGYLTGLGAMLLVLGSGAVLLLVLLAKLGAMLWCQPPRRPALRGVLAALAVNLVALLLLWRDLDGERSQAAFYRAVEQDLPSAALAWALLLAAVWWACGRQWRRPAGSEAASSPARHKKSSD